MLLTWTNRILLRPRSFSLFLIFSWVEKFCSVKQMLLSLCNHWEHSHLSGSGEYEKLLVIRLNFNSKKIMLQTELIISGSKANLVRIRWKFETFFSSRYFIYENCQKTWQWINYKSVNLLLMSASYILINFQTTKF